MTSIHLSLSDGLVPSVGFVRLTVREEPVDNYTDNRDCNGISDWNIVVRCSSSSFTDKH